MLVHNFLENSAKRLPDKVALICGDQRLTYQQINNAAELQKKAAGNIYLTQLSQIPLSSTQIRQHLSSQSSSLPSNKRQLHPSVQRYIEEKGLYKN